MKSYKDKDIHKNLWTQVLLHGYVHSTYLKIILVHKLSVQAPNYVGPPFLKSSIQIQFKVQMKGYWQNMLPNNISIQCSTEQC